MDKWRMCTFLIRYLKQILLNIFSKYIESVALLDIINLSQKAFSNKGLDFVKQREDRRWGLSLHKTQSDLRKMYNCTQAAKYINQTAKDIKRFKRTCVAPSKLCRFLSYFAYFVCKRGPSLFRNKYLLGYPIIMGIIHRRVSCVKTMSFCDRV